MNSIVVPAEIRHKIIADNKYFAKDIRGIQDSERFFNIIFEGQKCPVADVFIRFINELGRNAVDLKYLEIGAGYGFSMIDCIKKGFNVIGIEPGSGEGFEGRYELAKELLAVNSIENVDAIRECTGEDMDCFHDASFDVVYSIAVLEHVKNIEKVLSEADRVLKKMGLCT